MFREAGFLRDSGAVYAPRGQIKSIFTGEENELPVFWICRSHHTLNSEARHDSDLKRGETLQRHYEICFGASHCIIEARGERKQSAFQMFRGLKKEKFTQNRNYTHLLVTHYLKGGCGDIL